MILGPIQIHKPSRKFTGWDATRINSCSKGRGHVKMTEALYDCIGIKQNRCLQHALCGVQPNHAPRIKTIVTPVAMFLQVWYTNLVIEDRLIFPYTSAFIMHHLLYRVARYCSHFHFYCLLLTPPLHFSPEILSKDLQVIPSP
jgi:hypothetical protein